ncbi:hypothetical protein A3860_37295 [Niastella vici]|uniref:Uncharacterized protein n=1 Tax=Niastella vici TaxID=1703345 RepID=A0A1V9FML6_9BACT|nr:hypothetical protein [Niastella vici]OQP59496.1 hypothetical protein A3860_37295 [Niastella vici]
MHLSNEIQRRLDKLNSNVKLASTIDGTFPGRYSFYGKPGRSFRTEFAFTENDFSIVLFERTEKQNYENCFARGLFTDLERLAVVIDLWVDKQKNISAIKSEFDELELYSDFEHKNPNADIDKAWTKVKNMFFNNTRFWKWAEWNERYLEMLNKAKRHKAFECYFPFTSHYWLRFSIDKDIKETWKLGTYIVPVMYSDEVPASLGKFYVSYNDTGEGGRFFETVIEALDFYADKLKEIKPVRWVF